MKMITIVAGLFVAAVAARAAVVDTYSPGSSYDGINGVDPKDKDSDSMKKQSESNPKPTNESASDQSGQPMGGSSDKNNSSSGGGMETH